jgi:hypothetical protein
MATRMAAPDSTRKTLLTLRIPQMCDHACTARIPAIGEPATATRLRIEWQESAHVQTDEIQAPDGGAMGALVTVIVVLCTCVLSALLTSVLT